MHGSSLFAVLLVMTAMIAMTSQGCTESGQGADPKYVRQGLAAYEVGNLVEAKAAWMQAAEQDDPEAQFYLGVLANQGDGANATEAVGWFQKAAQAGHAKAQYNLALAYERGLGVLRNRKAAIEWLRKAAIQGDVDAQHMLALLLLDEDSVKEGAKWLTKAATAGHVASQLALGNGYLAGDVVAKDPSLAVKWLSRALRSGEVRALRPLLTAREQLVTFDATPLEALKQAARASDPASQHRLAARLLSGLASERDPRAGEAWLRKSAAAGFAAAQYDLGLLLVDELPEEGLKWLRRAADKGMSRAQYALGRAYAQGVGAERDEGEAYAWYMRAAEQGMPSAEYAVGYALSQGAGVHRNDAEALTWYKRAAAHGHHESAFRISNMYANGEGVSKSAEESRRWECRALVLGNHQAAINLARRDGIDVACGVYRDDLITFATGVFGKPSRR